MASLDPLSGVPMHANRYLLIDVLKNQVGGMPGSWSVTPRVSNS